MNEVTRYELPATAAEIRQNVNLIQEVMHAVMKNGIHYGTIPGTPKPTLYKAGAEKIFSTFRIAIDPEAEDLSTPEEIRYRIKARATHQSSGIHLGTGNGECSSNEEKYRWRKPVCDEEWNEAPEDERREVWKKTASAPAKIKQVRIRPADIANTVLKMATKRAMVAACLLVTAASDVFDQDIEDLPEGYDVGGSTPNGKPPVRPPKRKSDQEPIKTVDAVDVKKQGKNKNGQDYTIWSITISGVKYDTFDAAHTKIATEAMESKRPVTIQFKEGKFGRDLTSIALAGAPAEPAQEEPPTGGPETTQEEDVPGMDGEEFMKRNALSDRWEGSKASLCKKILNQAARTGIINRVTEGIAPDFESNDMDRLVRLVEALEKVVASNA